jgi:hypothetical protein
MRAAPALQVRIDRCGSWRLAVCALATISVAPGVVWLATLNLAALPALLVTLLALLAAAALTWRLTRLSPVVLRYDGEHWHLGADDISDAHRSGDVSVVMDIGVAMLLRFDAKTTPPSRLKRWLPVRALDLGAQWHALRCAVYSPPPSAPLGSTATEIDL